MKKINDKRIYAIIRERLEKMVFEKYPKNDMETSFGHSRQNILAFLL